MMDRTTQEFKLFHSLRAFSWGDAVVLFGIGVLIYSGIHLAMGAPQFIAGPEIDLAPTVLPYYLSLSLGRMAAAYVLSVIFSLIYGSLAAKHQLAEKMLLPLLDVLQSVPILSFLPVVLLSFSAILPQRLAVELSAVVLIFTSQAWNLTFAWYQSLTTIPTDLREASTIFRLNYWLLFKKLELPFAAISLIWNSMMSWAGGWFFLMAAEIFTSGNQDFRLQGLGSYLQLAANSGDFQAIAWGMGTLIGTIVILDQLVWRPLLVWGQRFKLGMVVEELPPTSWFYEALRSSLLISRVYSGVLCPLGRLCDYLLARPATGGKASPRKNRGRSRFIFYFLGAVLIGGMLFEAVRAVQLLMNVSWLDWVNLIIGVMATLVRVLLALLIALAWTIPLGVAIGTNRRLAIWLQPLVQVAASVPATALFPVVLLAVLKIPGGLNLAAVLLMLMGTQWYLLFNVIAGASAIPQDLKYTATLLNLSRWRRWRVLILPALFPYIITGAITASGGAWNASIVAEYVQFGGQTLFTTGVGSIIAQSTGSGNYPMLLASTLGMILAVTTINRLVWRRLYRVAEEKFRMD